MDHLDRHYEAHQLITLGSDIGRRHTMGGIECAENAADNEVASEDVPAAAASSERGTDERVVTAFGAQAAATAAATVADAAPDADPDPIVTAAAAVAAADTDVAAEPVAARPAVADDVASADAEPAPPKLSRKVRRRSRRTRPRSRTIAMKRLTREELRIGALLNPPVDIPRPRTRAECAAEARPCPWVACKHHLYLDVNPDTGSIKINFPDLEPWELTETCALDVADRGGITLEEVGEIMNLTRERIRQVEVRGLLKLKMASPSPEELGSGDTDDL